MTNDLTIRPASPHDYDSIADVWFDSWVSTGLGQTSDASRDDLRQRLETEDDWDLLVAIRHERLSGMLALKPRSAKLDQIFVHPEDKGQGIGRRLMREAKERLPDGMWLKAHRRNVNALRFYRSEGFIPDLERPYGDHGPDDIFLTWRPAR